MLLRRSAFDTDLRLRALVAVKSASRAFYVQVEGCGR
jgi:hypothetical protein